MQKNVLFLPFIYPPTSLGAIYLLTVFFLLFSSLPVSIYVLGFIFVSLLKQSKQEWCYLVIYGRGQFFFLIFESRGGARL